MIKSHHTTNETNEKSETSEISGGEKVSGTISLDRRQPCEYGARMQLFDAPADYEAFERVLAEAHERVAMRTLAYCVLPPHWHLVLWPREDGELSRFMAWVTLTHTQRWHAHRHTTGSGHLVQGRFKSFPVQTDEHLLMVCRYVERNPLRAGLVRRAEEWRWASLWRRTYGDAAAKRWLSEHAGKGSGLVLCHSLR